MAVHVVPVALAYWSDQPARLTGVVPRSEIVNHFFWADVLLLPSVCEGSAGSIFEALAAGLPAICTPNSGSVVEDGVSGIIVPAESVDHIVAALDRVCQNRDELAHMGQMAIAASQKWSLSSYGDRLSEILSQHLASSANHGAAAKPEHSI